MSHAALRSTPSRTLPIIVWTIRAVAAAAFLAAGVSKLIGVADMVQVFEAIGIGQWFRSVTGSVEIAGAILLVIPATTLLGAALLAFTMACATATHLLIIGGDPLPAIVLLALSTFLAWTSRADLARFGIRR